MNQLIVTIGVIFGIWFVVWLLKPRNVGVATTNKAPADIEEELPQKSAQSAGMSGVKWLKEALGTKEGATDAEKTFKKRAAILLFFVITVTIGYLLPDGASKLTYLGWVVIGVFHLYVILAAYIDRNIGNTTILLAKGWFIILIIGWFLPAPMWQTWEDIKGMRNESKDNPDLFRNALSGSSSGKTPAAEATSREVPQQNLPTFVTTTRVLHLEPGGIFKSVPTPPGTRIIHDVIWSCPQGCIMEIEHTSDMMCKNWAGTETDEAGRVWHVGTYNGDTTCTVTSIGVTRFRERFAALPGATNWTLEFPNNLVGIITSFGTIEAIGPIEITVSTVTS